MRRLLLVGAALLLAATAAAQGKYETLFRDLGKQADAELSAVGQTQQPGPVTDYSDLARQLGQQAEDSISGAIASLPAPPKFVHCTVPATGWKRLTPPGTATYRFRPNLTPGQRVSGTLTVTAIPKLDYGSGTMAQPWPPYRMLLNGQELAMPWDTTQTPNGTHVLSAQVMDPQGKDVANGSIVVVVNNAGTPWTDGLGQAVVGQAVMSQVYNSLACGRVDVSPPLAAPLSHNPTNHPDATTDADRQKLATQKVWWVEYLTQPGTGLYWGLPLLVKNAAGDHFVTHWYPASFNDSANATPVVGKMPAYDGPRNVGVLNGYFTFVRGFRVLADGFTGWLGVDVAGRMVDVAISGEVTTIFGPRSVAGVVGTDPALPVTLAQRLTAGEKEFVGDPSGGTLTVAQDLWMLASAPDLIRVADTGNNRVAVLDRSVQKIVATIPLAGVSSVWGDETLGWYACAPSGLYRLTPTPVLAAAISGCFWTRGSHRGTVYALSNTTGGFWEYDPATSTATLRLAGVAPNQKFAFFDVDTKGNIGPTGRIYVSMVNSPRTNTGVDWIDPATWQRFAYQVPSCCPHAYPNVINYQVYGSWAANVDAFGHYLWTFAIHLTMPKFIASGISEGPKVWSGHLGPLPVPDAAIASAGTPEFRIGKIDAYLGLGAIFGALGHGRLGYSVDQWREQTMAAMCADLDPLFHASQTASERANVCRMAYAQRTRKHF